MAVEKGQVILVSSVFCDLQIQSNAGLHSIINVHSGITLGSTLSPAELSLQKIRSGSNLLIMLQSEKERNAAIRVVGKGPSGARVFDASHSGKLAGDWNLTTIPIPVIMEIGEEGLYWFEILLTGTVIGKVPLTVKFDRLPRQQS